MSKLKITKTTFWQTESGQTVSLDKLPPAVMQQVEIYDAMRQDLTDIKYQEQVYTLSLAAKRQHVEMLIVQLLKSQEEQRPSEEQDTDK